MLDRQIVAMRFVCFGMQWASLHHWRSGARFACMADRVGDGCLAVGVVAVVVAVVVVLAAVRLA